MRSRLVAAWIEMGGAAAIAATLLAIDFFRQRPFAGWVDAAVSLSLTVVVATFLLLVAGIRLREALAGLPDPRAAQPTARGMIGIFVFALTVLLALAPTLIKL